MTSFSRRSFFARAAAVGAALGLPSSAVAQGFPERGRPVRVVIPFSPGGTTDTWGRPFARVMSDVLGTPIVVENRAGAEGTIGVQSVKNSAPDGYTILFTSLSTQVVGPHLFRQPPYDPLRDFIPLSTTLRAPFAVFCGPSLPFRTAPEFLAAARREPEKYTFGSISSATRIAGEMFTRAAGIRLLNVNYRNFSEMISDLLAGRIDVYLTDAASMLPFLARGVRSIGAASLTRLTIAPDVPTLDEQGLTGFQLVSWHGIYAPAATPDPVVATLLDAIRRCSSSPDVVEALTRIAVEPFNLTGADFVTFQRTEYERWGQAIRDAGLAGTM